MAASSGDAHPWPIYNARFRVVFPILDADGDLVTAAATLDSELSQDQGTFADATNEATEIATSSGIYYLDLVAGEMDTNNTSIIVKTATAGAKTTFLGLYPRRFPVIRTGTAQAGGASTITLDSGASALDDFYNGGYVNITNNSPANAQGQARRITDYVGSTKVATVASAWGTNPDSTSTFEILLPGETAQVAGWGGSAIATPSVAGVPEADLTHIVGAAVSTTTAQLGVNVVSTSTGAITAASIATDAIDADAIAASAVTEIQAGLSTLTAAQVNAEVVDALNVDTYAEPGQGTPPATATLVQKIGYLFKAWRNRTTQTASQYSLYNDDALTIDQKATFSDNGTTADRGEVATGP